MKKILIVLGVCFAITATAQSRFVTLKVATSNDLPVDTTNSVVITASETAELVTLVLYGSPGMEIIKDGTTFFFDYAALSSIPVKPLVITGPAVIRMRTNSTFQKGFCTLKISPESFSPDKTIIIPEGIAGATVTLECSTNLLNWSPATNGFYSGTNSSKFFRISAERAQ